MKTRDTVAIKKDLKSKQARSRLLIRSVVTGLIMFACLSFGAMLGMYFILGVITLVGFVLIVESIPALKFLCKKLSRTLDVAILAGAILAVMYFGVTVAASLTIAGVGYSLWYAPYLRATDMNVSVLKYKGVPYGVSFS